MDGSRFDDLTRAMATGISRRGALRALLGAAAIGLAGGLPRGTGFGLAAGPESKDESVAEWLVHRAGKRCWPGQSCGPLAPCTNGYCTPLRCLIGGRLYLPEKTNPDNPCQWCNPTLDSWDEWSMIGDGLYCAYKSSTPCHFPFGICLDGECIRKQRADGDSCGPDQVCCDGSCCALGERCGANGCESELDDCVIDGTAYEPGQTNLDHDCQVCDPVRDPFGWSPVDGQPTCGGVPNRICCNGDCCPPDQCCSPTGLCQPCGCETHEFAKAAGEPGEMGECSCSIGEEVYAPGATNPANACEVCDPDRDPAAWSVAADASPCGDGSDRVCCAGACCPEEQCCIGGACAPCGCEIAGQEYGAGEINSANRCQVCDPDRDPFAWSPLRDDFPCAFDAPRVCCGGLCCAADQCCDAASGTCGACEPQVCTIDGVVYQAYERNPNNECEHCDPFASTTAWSFNGFASCGPTGEQFCNANGACCPLGHTPDATAPGFCSIDLADGVCVIDGVLYYSEDFEPTGGCQICNPSVSQTSWTIVC
jgi:hypothetical protein